MAEGEKASPQITRAIQEKIWKGTHEKKYQLYHKNFEINVNYDF